MLDLLGMKQRFCDGMPRRNFLKIGAFGAGLALADMLRLKAQASNPAAGARPTANKSAIMIYLPGGPSHMDMYDLKPDAPMEFRGELSPPDLDNRSPSLASFLAEALDARMRAALGELCRPVNGERVAPEALTLVTNQHRDRRWAQGWKLFDNTGPLLRIDVEVDEARDPECAIRLNSRVILRCVPPWIQDRRAAVTPIQGEEDEKRREAFYENLMEKHVRPALVAEEHWVRRWERSPNAAI